MPSISVAIDGSQLAAWATELSASKIRSTLASALNKAARAARKDFIAVAAQDIGVPVSRVKASVSNIVRASPSNLSAKFVVSKSRIGIRNTMGAIFSKGSGLTAHTHVLTGGGSASLSAPKAFLLQANGGQVIMVRVGKGRATIKGIYAEGVNTALSQPAAAPRLKWIRDADTITPHAIADGMQRVLNGGSVPSDTSSND
jgi:hypothetical protein